MNKIKIFKAARVYARIDHFLKEACPDISRSKIEKFIKDGKVKLNGQLIERKNREITPGDRVEVTFIEPEIITYHPSGEFKKLFEDEHLLIIDKPSGISVHPGAGEKGETILDMFAYYYPQIKKIAETDRPGIVHRLDKDTSGVLILSKDGNTMKKMQKKFKKREIKKSYLALISGWMRQRNGTLDTPISRNLRDRRKFSAIRGQESEKAREAVTNFSVIREFPGFSFVRLCPLTGRTHQLRVHLSYCGCPILGDRVYGHIDSFERLALHAYSIEFHHPVTGNLIITTSPLPRIFRDFLKMAAAQKEPIAPLLPR